MMNKMSLRSRILLLLAFLVGAVYLSVSVSQMPAEVKPVSTAQSLVLPTVTEPYLGPKVAGNLHYADVCEPGGIAVFTNPAKGLLKTECLSNAPHDTSEYRFEHKFLVDSTVDDDWSTFSAAYIFPASLVQHNANQAQFYTSCVGKCTYTILDSSGNTLQEFASETDVWVDVTYAIDAQVVWVLIQYQGTGGNGNVVLNMNVFAVSVLEVEPH